jgi:DNA repair exonuclease SbcCD ATPase subunit
MKLNSIEIKNFLSIKYAKIQFDKYSEVVRIVGENKDTTPISSNGAGKSSIIEAVVFGLFGRTIRKSSEKTLTNKYGNGSCKVKVVLNDNVVVTRIKKPPSLRVEIKGKSYTKDNIQNTQKNLEALLNTNYNVFLASIVFGQGNKVNFLSSSPEEKRIIIQNFLNATELFSHRSAIKTLKSSYMTEKKAAQTLCDETVAKLSRLDSYLGVKNKMRRRFRSVLTSEKYNFIKSHSLSEIKDLESVSHAKDLEYRGAGERISFLTEKKEALKLNIRNMIEDTCEHCGKTPVKIKELLATKAKELDGIVNTLQNERRLSKNLSKEIDAILIPITSQDYEDVEAVLNVETEIKILKREKKESRKNLSKYEKMFASASKGYDLMRYWENAFSENGLVKYIIRNILQFFNFRANYYLDVLTHGDFRVKFDDSLGEIIYNNDTEAPFDTLSGGEKKKVSLAVMLGLNDLLFLSGKEGSNVVFFDEVADSLDPKGIAGLYELINELKETKTVFVITHNPELEYKLEDCAKLLKVTKKGGITKVK